jgi:hypothetical protein
VGKKLRHAGGLRLDATEAPSTPARVTHHAASGGTADAEAAADWARSCVYIVDAAVQTVREATSAADRAADLAYRASAKVDDTLTRLRDPFRSDSPDAP